MMCMLVVLQVRFVLFWCLLIMAPKISLCVSLAWKLGLVEVLSAVDDVTHKKGVCAFSHLLVIDFEATCWEQRKGPSEIIEFPAVLLDLTSGCIIDEFHEYVSPTENPKLSAFCKKLTGIEQEQVEGKMPLKTCLMTFIQWFNSTCKYHGVKSVALVTWSDWDLKICLSKECSRKSIVKPSVFNKWIDLRAIFREHVHHHPRGLKSAVNEMGLEFEGREHSGIWDARNTAKLAWKLHTSGAILYITKDMAP